MLNFSIHVPLVTVLTVISAYLVITVMIYGLNYDDFKIMTWPLLIIAKFLTFLVRLVAKIWEHYPL